MNAQDSASPIPPSTDPTPAELRKAAAGLQATAGQLLARAAALEDEGDEMGEIKARPTESGRTAKERQDAHLTRQSWALYGQLVLRGYITPPNWRELHVGEIVRHAFTQNAVLADMESILERVDQQTVEEWNL